MMALQNLWRVTLTVCLLLIFRATAVEKDVEFDYVYETNESTQFTISIVKSTKTYNGTLTDHRYLFGDNGVLTSYPVEKSTIVNCQHFICYEPQDVGVYTCQDEDNKYFAIPSGGVTQKQITYYSPWKIVCEDLVDYIIEGEEIATKCKVKCTEGMANGYKITIGWIQGTHDIIQSFDLIENDINFIQTFKGYQGGDGIFFYCLNIYNPHKCYTLTLKVYPKLNLKMMTIHGNREHCFKCLATGGSGPKDYQWTSDVLLETGYNGENDDERCFNNLTTGEYTVKCFVTTAAQNKSGEIKFIVADVVSTDTTTQTSPLTTQTSTSKDTGNSDIDVIIIILIVTICLLLFAVMLSLYVILRRNYSEHPKMKRGHHNIVATSNSRQQTEAQFSKNKARKAEKPNEKQSQSNQKQVRPKQAVNNSNPNRKVKRITEKFESCGRNEYNESDGEQPSTSKQLHVARSKPTDNDSTIANHVEFFTNGSSEYQELQIEEALDAEGYLEPMHVYMYLKK